MAIQKIEITAEEAHDVVEWCIANFGAQFNSDEAMKAQAMTGVIIIARALQEMGFRISRPLKEVG